MGFTTKRNPVTLGKARIKELEEELARLKLQPTLKAFAERFGSNMLVILAQTPFTNWPQFAKEIFKYSEREAPTAAYFYKELLPKE